MLNNNNLNRSVIIKAILIITILFVVLLQAYFQDTITENLTPNISKLLINLGVITEFTEDYAESLVNLTLFIEGIFTFILIYFIVSFRDTLKFINRLKRSFFIGLLLLILGFGLLFSALVMLTVPDVEGSIVPFLADLSSGLGTEVMGALGLFLLLEVFAKTWEENEEAEYAEQRNQSKETQEQLELILARWHQTQADYLQQAKQASEKSIFNRLLSPQQMPSAYYEGQAQALDSVIKDIQNLIAEPNTLPSDLVADEVK